MSKGETVEERVDDLEKKAQVLEDKLSKLEDNVEKKFKDLYDFVLVHDHKLQMMRDWFKKVKILTNNYVITEVDGRKIIKIKPTIITKMDDVKVVERTDIGEW
ncbi:MAG: hypothetical protein ACUVTM_06325 [Candidatus Bathyarchaeia archaeon]